MKKKFLIIIGILLMIMLCGIIFFLGWYNLQQKPVNKDQVNEIQIEIKTGMSTDEILNLLYDNGIIRNVFASKIYVKLNNINNLQAGKYKLGTDLSLDDILKQISSGKIMNETISITFVEGKNIRWIAKTIAEKTNNTEEQVYELLSNRQYIESLIDKYWFLTDDVLNENIYYPLEGYLWPDTYQFESKDILVEDIFTTLLNQTEYVLKQYKSEIEKSGIGIHKVLTMASIIELEGNDEKSKSEISSVIYNRLSNKMSLGSDVTTYYAIKVDMNERNLYKSEINSYNAYNTRGPNMEGKLPVGPIAMVSKESINAVLNPAQTNYLYFVADTNGKVYFSETYEEHKNIIDDLRNQGLWYEYE